MNVCFTLSFSFSEYLVVVLISVSLLLLGSFSYWICNMLARSWFSFWFWACPVAGLDASWLMVWGINEQGLALAFLLWLGWSCWNAGVGLFAEEASLLLGEGEVNFNIEGWGCSCWTYYPSEMSKSWFNSFVFFVEPCIKLLCSDDEYAGIRSIFFSSSPATFLLTFFPDSFMFLLWLK